MKAVLDNFLGTFVSRNSDYRGYWLFGFLVAEAESFTVDLLAVQSPAPSASLSAASDLAVQMFEDQLAKNRFDRSLLRTASLFVERLPLTVEGQVNGHGVAGYQVHVSASAVTEQGRRYQSERAFFVAPHDPRVEWRSTRADNQLVQQTATARIVSVVQKLLGRDSDR
jgi:hypothetical protein